MRARRVTCRASRAKAAERRCREVADRNRPRGDREACEASARRERDPLRDQRQDDERRDDVCDPRFPLPAGPQRRRCEPRLGRRVRPRRRTRCRAGLVRGRRGGAGRTGRRRPAARHVSRQSLSRPARPLRGAGADRRALAGDGRGPPEETLLVVNADDPLVADLARSHASSATFGVDDPSQRGATLQHAADSKYCVRCGAPYVYPAAYVGHLGDYRCPSCGHTRPPLDVAARAIESHGIDGISFDLCMPEGTTRVRLQVPGVYNVYNALAAASVARDSQYRRRRSPKGWVMRRRRSGASSASPSAGRRSSCCSSRTPRGQTRR